MHLDIIGRELTVDNFVIADRSLYKITKLTPNMVRLEKVFKSRYGSNKKLLYAKDLTLVPEHEVLIYMLKKNHVQ